MDVDRLATEKERLRREALYRRDALDRESRAISSDAIADRAVTLLDGYDPVGAYWPIRSEVNSRPLLEKLASRGVATALSRVDDPHLSWHLWAPGDPLATASFGVAQPLPEAPLCKPQALIVPLAAFDRAGGRIGYGRGHFDRAIAALAPVLTIGLAFACQEIDAVPQEPHDRPLDLVVTEREVIRAHRI